MWGKKRHGQSVLPGLFQVLKTIWMSGWWLLPPSPNLSLTPTLASIIPLLCPWPSCLPLQASLSWHEPIFSWKAHIHRFGELGQGPLGAHYFCLLHSGRKWPSGCWGKQWRGVERRACKGENIVGGWEGRGCDYLDWVMVSWVHTYIKTYQSAYFTQICEVCYAMCLSLNKTVKCRGSGQVYRTWPWGSQDAHPSQFIWCWTSAFDRVFLPLSSLLYSWVDNICPLGLGVHG